MKNNKISKRVDSIEISGIRKFYNKVAGVEGAISLTLGQPDFPIPKAIKDAVINAVIENKTSYTSNAGIDPLREEISKYLNTQNIHYNKDEICITVGGSEGLMDVFAAFINPQDKVLIPTPAYPAYESCVKLLGGTIINYNLNSVDFSINYEELGELIEREKPKILVISYPCNPTGAVLTKEGNEKLHKLIKEKDILVVSDEMYSSLCFNDEYFSIAQYEDIKEKVIVVGGFSKMFSMTGLRIGYICAIEDFMNGIMKVHQYNVSCAPSIVQWGAYEGLKSSMDDLKLMKSEFIKRKDYLYNELIRLGFEVNCPEGAFYIFPSIKKFNMSSEEFCERLLNEGKVAIVPGNAFGEGGEGYIRISYAYSMEELKEAVRRIETWLKFSICAAVDINV